MFFEGAEKKIEIMLKSSKLFEMDRSFWEDIVKQCEATILSSIENEHVKAYLLSESSLFVWQNRILMLTCGETKLIRSVKKMIEAFGSDDISCLIYQRKNEYRSHLQSSHFEQDVNDLRADLDGTALRFGKLHGHHNLLFHSQNAVDCDDDSTIELLMYDMDKELSKYLTTKGLAREQVREFLGVEAVFPDFAIDDFSFDPYGYSLNAIKGHLYFTIHVTPQESSPYVSFETNMPVAGQERLLTHFLETLKPDSFDIMSFNQQAHLPLTQCYFVTCDHEDRLECGFDVQFKSYQCKDQEKQKPFLIE
jgi:S-adenosylmethionine decarboxylase